MYHMFGPTGSLLQGKFAKAEPLFRRSLAMQEKALGPEHPDVAASLNNCANALRGQVKTAFISRHISPHTVWKGPCSLPLRQELGGNLKGNFTFSESSKLNGKPRVQTRATTKVA